MGKYEQIVFVCTGNTCRSPMAEGLLKAQLAKVYLDDEYIVLSRGLMVFGPGEVNAYAAKAMEERGVNINSHRSRPFDEDELGNNALVLTMTDGHKTVLLQRGIKSDVYSIKEFVGQSGDVDDPFGGTIEVYRRCADELDELIGKLGGLIK